MRTAIGCAALAALISTSLSAQTVPAEAVAVQPETPAVAATTGLLTLPQNTPIQLVVAEEANSSTHRAGDNIRLTVLNDVSVGSTVVIPRGTPASAVITWRTGKGAFGKSGKLEFNLEDINLNGQHIPVTGSYRQEGEGNTIATGVGILAVGVFAGFITGKRARLPVGRELMSQLAQPVEFSADGHLAASYNSHAAVAAANASTPFGQCRTAAAAVTDTRQRERATRECFRERME